MPIIELVPEIAPLSQGDILRDIKLFSTKDSGINGGEAALASKDFCICISRPCVAVNKEHVTVLLVEKITGGVPDDVKSLEDVQRFLKHVRDGNETPDIFYLGELEGTPGRFAARLDSFHDIYIPSDLHERQAFLRERRIGRLHIDFARDLHVRIFRAFASFGFDDLRWFSNDDLKWVVNKGRVEIAEARAKLHKIEAAKQKKAFSEKAMPDNVVKSAEIEVHRLEVIVAPFEDEMKRRSISSNASENDDS